MEIATLWPTEPICLYGPRLRRADADDPRDLLLLLRQAAERVERIFAPAALEVLAGHGLARPTVTDVLVLRSMARVPQSVPSIADLLGLSPQAIRKRVAAVRDAGLVVEPGYDIEWGGHALPLTLSPNGRSALRAVEQEWEPRLLSLRRRDPAGLAVLLRGLDALAVWH